MSFVATVVPNGDSPKPEVGTNSPPFMTAGGRILVDASVSGGGGNAAAGATGSAVPADADYIGFSNGSGSLVGVSAANPLPVVIESDIGTVTVQGTVNVTQLEYTPTSVSGTISNGGTAQNASSVFSHGYEFINSSTGTIWISGTTVAAANTAGSIPVWPGGAYQTPQNISISGTLSIFGTVTGAAFTGRVW